MNLRRILLDPAARGVRARLDGVDLISTTALHVARWDVVMNLMHECEELFSQWKGVALRLAPDVLTDENLGARIAFETRFYTKNVPGPSSKFTLSGDIERDPHIWTKMGSRKIFLPLDPRWFTTSTSYANFRSGSERFAGLGILRRVDASRAVVAPLVIYVPERSG